MMDNISKTGRYTEKIKKMEKRHSKDKMYYDVIFDQ